MKEVVTIFDPEIDVNQYGEMKIEDEDITKDSNDNYARKVGRYSPFIDINGHIFMDDDIISLSISVGESFLPTLQVTVRDNHKFLVSYSNLSDYIVKVFIRSQNREFKPIRQNYHITSSYYSGTDESREYTMSGTLFIEGLHTDVVKSWGRLNSFDLCQRLAKDLKLGFATNELATNDEMCRICPNVTLMEFIKTDVETSIYKDDDSFFKLFVDQYYYLNLIEVNQLISCKLDIKLLSDTLTLIEDHQYNEETQDPELKEFLLGNIAELGNRHCYFSEYSVNNNIGSRRENGSKLYSQYYDNKEKKYKEFYVEPLVSKDITERHMTTDQLDPTNKSINFSEQYNDNVHSNYYTAKLLNSLNKNNFSLFSMEFSLSDINPMLHCYMSVPIVIEEKDNTRLVNPEYEQQQNNLVIDRYLTGMYVITGMKYEYDSDQGMKHQVRVAKRELERQQIIGDGQET